MPNRSSTWAKFCGYSLKAETDDDSAKPDDEVWYALVRWDGIQALIDTRLYDKQQTRSKAEHSAETAAREDASKNGNSIPLDVRPEWSTYDA
jgi:hypothetical protein